MKKMVLLLGWLLIMAGCIESNPQPMPIGKDTSSADTVTVSDVVADLSYPDVPREDMAAEVMTDIALDAATDLDASDVGVDTADGGDVVAPPSPPGIGAALGGILIASVRYFHIEEGGQETANIHGHLYGTPVDPYVGPYDQGEPFLAVTAQEGFCSLMTSEPAECAAPCEDGTICKGTECVAWPKPVSAGNITVEGVKAGTVKLKEAYGQYYSDPQDHDLFDGNSTVTLKASGGDDLPAFTGTVQGFEPLDTGWDNGFVLELKDGEAGSLTWTPGAADDFVRLVIKSQSSCHGCPLHAQLVCDAPDTGSLTVPASLVAKLPAIYAADICVAVDCPMSYLERRRCDVVAMDDGPIHVCLSSRIYFEAQHGPQ